MTIQQGTSSYIYPLSDEALPPTITVLNYAKRIWKERAYCRIQQSMVPFRDDPNYTLAMADVLETNGRYAGPLPNFPQGAVISSEANLAARECAREFYQEVGSASLRWVDGDYRDSPARRMYSCWFNRGQGRPQTPLRYTVQSIVEHYLFGKAPVSVSTDKDSVLVPSKPYFNFDIVEQADELDHFRTLMALYAGKANPLGYWYSDKPGMTCSIYLSYPAIPKAELDRYLGSYDIDALVKFYHGLFSWALHGADATNYVTDNWYERIAGLVRSVVYCQYWWSLRCEQQWPLPAATYVAMENGDPMLKENYGLILLE